MDVSAGDLSDAQLQKWAALASQCIGAVLDASHHVLSSEREDNDSFTRFVMAQLFISCHLTTESALILVTHAKVWDADILMRSVLEGTFKLLFMLLGDEKQRRQRAEEYWSILPEAARLVSHRRASALMQEIPDAGAPQWAPIRELVLPDDVVADIKQKYPKQACKRLKQKWSFMEIAKFLVEYGDPRYRPLASMAYGYGMQSHLMHQDGEGVGMVWERMQRDPVRQESITSAHGARVVSDSCTYAFVRAKEVLRVNGGSVETISSISDDYRELFEEIEVSERLWNEIEYGPGDAKADHSGDNCPSV